MENKKKYYFVGASIDDEDQTARFVKKGKWQLGWFDQKSNAQYQKMLLKLNKMKPGDSIIIKATFTQKNELPFENSNGKLFSVMKLKAKGIITQNLYDGHTIKVDWDKNFEPKNWYFFTGRETIWDVSASPFESAKKLINFVENDVPQDYQWFLSQPDWAVYENDADKGEIKELTKDDINEFKSYLDKFIEVVKQSAGNIGKDKNGKDISNYVVGGTIEGEILPSGVKLGKRYASTGNRLYRFPYVNNQNSTNLYFDWKPEYFDEPTLFVTIPNKGTEYFSYPLDEKFNVLTGKHPNDVFGYEAVSPINSIDYEALLRAMVKLTYNTTFNDELKQVDSELKEYQSSYTNLLLTAKNIILRGAPGTGKTYLANQIAADIISNGKFNDINKLSEDEKKQIGFVQFHPSYDYTDFVEGLRPITTSEGNATFALQNGSFKSFVEKAIAAYPKKGQDNFDEAWSKFFDAVSDAEINEGGYNKVTTLTNKPYPNLVTYDRDGMQGIYPKNTTQYLNHNQIYRVYRGLNGVPAGGLDNYRQAIVKHMKQNFGLKDYSEISIKNNTDKKFVFIIDEINRGQISKIFGELFFSIDPGYRGNKDGVLTQYSNLHDDPEEKFYIPDNVYIIGTMNDIDRSVDTFDFAMR